MKQTVSPDPAARLARSCEPAGAGSADYTDRVNRAIDHITQHLAEPLNLDDVAKVACFSSFHFHRVFRAVVGETLHEFVKRTRLERALFLMSHDSRTLTEVALACGFSSSSDFSRSFRAHFGVSPRAFDLDVYRRARRAALVLTTPEPSATVSDAFVVRMRDLPARRVAYLRVFRPYEDPERVRATYARLFAWAQLRGLEGGQWLGYQWEDPELVPLELCRYDVGLEIPEGVALAGSDVNEARFPPLKIAEVAIKGGLDVSLRALEWLYGSWLPRSGWAPDHQPCFEAWDGAPYAHGMAHFEVRAQLAVVDAALPR